MSESTQPQPVKHEPKPDVMASRAPEHVKRTVEETPSSGIEVMPPNYRPNFFGCKLDHNLYIDPSPNLDYKFCTNKNQFGQVGKNESRGWRTVTSSWGAKKILGEDAKGVNVGGMTLCARPKEYGIIDDQEKTKAMKIQRRKMVDMETLKHAAAEKLGISERTITSHVETREVEVMVPTKTIGEKL